jgi:hypothetical protein
VVIVLNIGCSKASNIKLVLKREPRIGKTWFPAGSILPNEAKLVDVAVRVLLEENGLILTLDDLSMLSINLVRVSLPKSNH